MSVSEPLVQASLLGEAIDPGPVAILVADEDGCYVAVNQFACEMLGYSREELLELHVADVAPGKQAARDYAAIVAGQHAEGVQKLVRKDGSTFQFQYRTRETRVAGMTVYLAVGSPESPGGGPAAA
jgi:PAS domain S-box-containing protein